MGFPLLEILIIAGIITISSSAIVAKVLVDLRRTGNNETELILGIIMFEDIFLAVYLSVVSGLVLGIMLPFRCPYFNWNCFRIHASILYCS